MDKFETDEIFLTSVFFYFGENVETLKERVKKILFLKYSLTLSADQ